MDIDFISDFLEFVSDKQVTSKLELHSVKLYDGDGDEIATIDEKGGVYIPMEIVNKASTDFVDLLFKYEIKLKPNLEENYNFLRGIDFVNGKGVSLTITSDNQILINFSK